MARFKLTFIFNAGRQGWSETWYATKSTYEAASQAAYNYSLIRMSMLGQGILLEAYRVSDEDIRGDSYVKYWSAETNTTNQVDTPRDNTNSAILCRCQASDLYRRQVWLRGIPDSFIEYNPDRGAFVTFPQAITRIAALLQSLKANGMQIKAISKAPEIAMPRSVNDAVKSGAYVEIFAPGHGMPEGTSVRISKAEGEGVEYVNGVWKVFPSTLNSFFIRSEIPANQALVYTGFGIYEKRIPIYADVTRLDYVRVASRDTGRAFFVPRGRSAKRR